MRFRYAPVALAALVAALIVGGLTPRGAEAHERRTVAGKYTFVVGFLQEPAITGQFNGIDLRISNAQTNQPVEGVEKTLKADVIVGGQTKTTDLRTRFNMPGAYTADLIPTKAGQWAFRFYGTIEGAQIDERFESGPGRFNDVEQATILEFPQASQTTPNAAPANSTNEAAAAAAADAQRALDKAESARTTGIAVGAAGIVVGLIGIVLAAVALNARRPRGGPGPAEPV